MKITKIKNVKESCIHCRIKCNQYRISDNSFSISEYENIALECKFYTEVLLE